MLALAHVVGVFIALAGEFLFQLRDIPIQDRVDIVLAARDARQTFTDKLLDPPRRESQPFRDMRDADQPRFFLNSLFHKAKPKSHFQKPTLLPARTRRHPRRGVRREGPTPSSLFRYCAFAPPTVALSDSGAAQFRRVRARVLHARL